MNAAGLFIYVFAIIFTGLLMVWLVDKGHVPMWLAFGAVLLAAVLAMYSGVGA